MATTINLLKVSPHLSPELVRWESRLKLAGIIALVVVLGLGIITGGVMLIAAQQERTHEEVKATRLQQLNALSQKESLITAITHRSAIVDKALSSIRPWGKVLDTITALSPVESINSVVVDPLGKVSSTFYENSIENAYKIVMAATRQLDEHAIKLAMLESLQLNEDGTVTFGITFSPVW